MAYQTLTTSQRIHAEEICPIYFWHFYEESHILAPGFGLLCELRRMNDKTDQNSGVGKETLTSTRVQRPLSPGGLRSRPSTGLLTGSVRERRAPLRGRITRQTASCCIARLLVLAAEDQRRPIVAYIDSPGGSARDLLSIVSTMNGIRCPIVTFCRGAVGGPATVIEAHGLRGFRVASPNARFSLKEFDFVADGGRMAGKEALLPLLAEILAKDARKQKAEVMEWLAKGAEFGSQEALRMGLIDQISTKPILPEVAAEHA